MVAAQKRKRGIVSYREPSSDDEDLLGSEAEIQTSTKRTKKPVRRSTRNRSFSPQVLPPSQQLPHRNGESSQGPRLNTRRPLRQRRTYGVSYKDMSSDEDEDDDFAIEEVEEQTQTRRTVAPSHGTRRSATSRKARVASDGSRARARKPLGAPLKPNKEPEPALSNVKIPTDGNIPDWASLPYHVLLQVFEYASYPLHDEHMVPTPAITWLLMVARLCKTFTKPALAVLYRTPPVHAVKQNQLLVQRLITPANDAQNNHQVMVKRLELDATQMSSSIDPLNDGAALSTLILALTTLKEIDIFDPLDRPPYRAELRRARRWYYPDELFAALRQSELFLRSWHWNRYYCAQGPLWMKEIHSEKAFQSLRELRLTKFDPDAKKLEDGTPTAEELLGSAIAALPNLTSLTFESCKIVNGRLLPLLPPSLAVLNITNCINLTSDDFQPFLADHGMMLEELVLNHNQCLSLSFLVDLKRFCPRLEVLKMDLNYYSSLVMSADNEPLYDSLLEPDELPTWPSTLRIIELEYLRNWSSDAATNFFRSLINAAEDLPQLRVLKLTAMVNVSWRQRAEYRKKWASWFEHVFASRAPNPSSHLASLRAYRQWKGVQDDDSERHDSLLDVTDGVDKSGDVHINGEQHHGVDSDSDVPLLKRKQKSTEKWNSQRLRTRGNSQTNYDESSDSEADSNDGSDTEEKPQVVQGRCHTVVFRIDNSRPREEVFNEGDFLDDEPSGDEDWDGNDVVDTGYAW
ncbi:hypothetical protein DM02DRAFT_716580 [Periconia macrospinosa]|uniref:Uncharacterized protein n=1 Tax=Periconia macrospinosa TaxID=97972 RepID=A0A2V1E401_9PLEO|nr:hypothetical protein DM02DRAFT_716580 [Periconia macrospinosa]